MYQMPEDRMCIVKNGQSVLIEDFKIMRAKEFNYMSNIVTDDRKYEIEIRQQIGTAKISSRIGEMYLDIGNIVSNKQETTEVRFNI